MYYPSQQSIKSNQECKQEGRTWNGGHAILDVTKHPKERTEPEWMNQPSSF